MLSKSQVLETIQKTLLLFKTSILDNEYSTKNYVDEKTSLENIIYEGDGTGIVDTYWTHCPLDDGNGCWVIDKEIITDSDVENPYYIQTTDSLNNITTYSPKNSTYDSTKEAWIYNDYKLNTDQNLYIYTKYENENKLVIPWDGLDCYATLKIFTKSELSEAMFSGDYNDLTNKPDIPKLVSEETILTFSNLDESKLATATEPSPYMIDEVLYSIDYSSAKEYYLSYGGKEYLGVYNSVPTTKLVFKYDDFYALIEHNDIRESSTNTKKSSIKRAPAPSDTCTLTIYKASTDNVTDVVFKSKEVKYLSNELLEKNVTVKQNLYVSGKITQGIAPTNNEDVATKKYVDDNKVSVNGLATEEYVNNKLLNITTYLDENITSSTPTVTYKNDYSAYTFNKIDIASIINDLKLELKVIFNSSDTVGRTITFKDFVYDNTLEAYSAYLVDGNSSDPQDKVYITNDDTKTIIVYSTEFTYAGFWKHIKLYKSEDKYINKTDAHTHSNKEVLDTITAEKVAQWDSNTGSGGGTTSGIKIETKSQSDYEALETKDPNTLYLITTTNAGTVDATSNDITLSDDLPAGTYTLKYEDENNQPLEGFDEITTMEVQ